MRCVRCGTENRPDRKFCAECGAPLARPCSTCGAANLPGERFCGECGTPLEPGGAAGRPAADPAGIAATSDGSRPASAEPAAGAAERRLVSVLFADLVGFTPLAEANDPEAVREVLDTYFDAARGVIERYGGTIEKFIGDAVMAMWGAPVAHEDDAERAVRAALELVDAVAALREQTRVPDLAARAGVLTGEAAVTLGARDQGLVAGDLVNSAARLQGVASPGSVLVGEATERATRDAIVFEPAGDHLVKGKSLPLAAWRAMRVVAGRRGVGRADRLEAPFVGRASELRALKDALASTGLEARPHLVSVIGQAGIGKSRLAWELEKYVDGLVESVYWHRGRSPSYGEGIAYWALAEMVRSRAGILETDTPGEAARKLTAAVAEYIGDAEDRRWIEPHLRALVGIEQGTAGDRSEQFGAWRRFFELVAGRGTAVLVFEDLQWADDGLLDFIDSLFEWSRSSPILVVALGRPELHERRPVLGGASRRAVALHLDPLTRDEMRELLTGLEPGLATDLVDAVVERAEGIPLFAIELVRMLRDEGGLEPSVGPARRLSIPPSLQALVAARLDALDPADRALLQDASVVGQTFTLRSLGAVRGEEPVVLEPRLRALVRREFLTVEADPRSPERGQYGFVQAVVHEVAYGTLARRDRRSRHLAAARYIDSLDDETMASVVASHYVEAYRAAPDDEQGRTIRAQARVALRAAAERSARLHNYVQAVHDLERAYELSDDPAERAGLLMQEAELDQAAARFDAAADLAERARAAYESIGDETRALQATARLGGIELKRGHLNEAGALFEQSLARLDPAADPELYARVAAEYARVHMQADRGVEGLRWADRALEAAGPSRDVGTIAEAMDTRGVLLQSLTRLDEGIATIRASVELAAAHHLSEAELRARYNLGGRLFADDPHEAIEVVRGGMEVAARTGRRDWLAMLAVFLGGMLKVALEFDDALAVYGTIPDEEWPPRELAEVRADRAEIAAYRGDGAAYREAAARVRRLAEEHADDQTRWGWATSATSVAFAEGRLSDVPREAAAIGGNWADWGPVYRAHVALREADPAGVRRELERPELATSQGKGMTTIRAAFGAAVAVLEGDRDRGRAGLAAAMAEARQTVGGRIRGELLLAAVAVLGPDDPDARAYADEARAMFERAGARAYLDRLEELLARPSTMPASRVRSAATGEGVRA